MKNAVLKILAIFIGLSSFFCNFAYAGPDKNSVPTKQEAFAALLQTGDGYAEKILDGLRLSLKGHSDDAPYVIQLSGIHVPGIDQRPPSAYAEQAQLLLEKLITAQQEIVIYQTQNSDKGRINRMGYHLAHIVRASDGLWLQGALLDAGLAYALPSKRNPEMTAQMYAREAQARAANRGMWADKKYAVLPAEAVPDKKSEFTFVEGIVTDVAETYSRTYLNFGENWKTDFTISIDKGMAKNMKEGGLDFTQLKSRKVRVRGWLEDWNGPHIKLYTPEHLEILSEPP